MKNRLKHSFILSGVLAAALLATPLLAQEGNVEEPALKEVGEASALELLNDEGNWCVDDGMALRMIREERDILNQQRERLEEEEGRIEVARARLESDMASLEELKLEVETILAKANEKYSEDIDKLVDLYSSMRDKDAAAIFEKMDIQSAVEVLAAMPERRAGPILSKMDRDMAQAISRVILDRSRLPADRELPHVHWD